MRSNYSRYAKRETAKDWSMPWQCKQMKTSSNHQIHIDAGPAQFGRKGKCVQSIISLASCLTLIYTPSAFIEWICHFFVFISNWNWNWTRMYTATRNRIYSNGNGLVCRTKMKPTHTLHTQRLTVTMLCDTKPNEIHKSLHRKTDGFDANNRKFNDQTNKRLFVPAVADL